MLHGSAEAAMERRTPYAAVAEAMNRVLAAESEAAAAIAAAQRDADAVIEAASARRRQILDVTRRRASRLHARAQEQLRRALDDLDGRPATGEMDLAALRALARNAITNLTARLASDDHEPH
jgi:hypothetical protein